MRRYYELRLQRNLFGEVVLMRRWGRIGGRGGSKRLETYGCAGEARAAFRLWRRAKITRGYRLAGLNDRRGGISGVAHDAQAKK